MDIQQLPGLLYQNVRIRPNREALYAKVGGRYQPLTYVQVYDQVRSFAFGLQDLGLKRGERVALLCKNRPEWVVADLAVMALGAVVVPIYPTLTPPEIDYIMQDCAAKIAIVETANYIPKAETVIVIEKSSHLRFSDLLKNKGSEKEFLDTMQSVTRDDLASIVYTSGTTGNPKGVMLTHGNFLSNVEDVLQVLPLTDQEVVLSFLPLSHVFERTAGYYSLLAIGGKVYYAENMDTVGDNIRECKPTVVVSVPRLYEKIQARILDGLHGLKKPIFYWALKVGQRQRKSNHRTVWEKLEYWFAKKLVINKVQARTGGRLRFFVSGGAPLGRELGRFFENLGLLIIEGYGLTEAAPIICCNRLDSYKMGTIGLPLPSQTIKLAEDGELLVKGPNIMKGYLNQETATKEAIDTEGWLHTGDIATIDSDGFVSIVDRKKEIIVLSNGKKVPPQVIERVLTTSKFISQVVAIGEKRNYLTALIVPHIVRLKKVAAKKGIKFGNDAELLKNPGVIEFYGQLVSQKLTDFANFEKVKKFVLLDHELSHETGELTPSLKPRRKIISEKFADQIEKMYKEPS